MLKRTNFGITLLLFVMFTSCVTTQYGSSRPRFIVNVDAISAMDTSQVCYYLLPADSTVDPGGLQFAEYSRYIKRALERKGLTPAENLLQAELVVFVAFGIGDPEQHTYSYSVPTWGQTGVASSRTTGSASVFGNFGNYSSTTTYTPQYGITGSRTALGSFTTYDRFIVLDAYSVENSNEPAIGNQLWKTTIKSTGSSGDLRRVFPVMVAAARNYVGENTGQIVEVTLFETDTRVREIKGELPVTKLR